MWLTTVTVWLFSREGVAKSPCKCGSGGGIYTEIADKLKQCSATTLITVSKIIDALLEQQDMLCIDQQ